MWLHKAIDQGLRQLSISIHNIYREKQKIMKVCCLSKGIVLIVAVWLTESSHIQTNELEKGQPSRLQTHVDLLAQTHIINSRLLTTCDPGCATCASWSSSRCFSCVDSTYLYDGWAKSCNLCSNTISFCVTCSSNFRGDYCTLCSGNTVYLSSGNCLSCSTSLTNCLTCSSSSQCLTCLNDLYYVDLDGQCHACSDHVSNCLTCESDIGLANFNCTACESVAYFLNSSGLCESCQADMPFCVNCTNSSYCLSCINNSYAYEQTINACVPCASMFDNCSLCTYSRCTRCQQGFALTSRGTCECPVGKLVAGLCTTIVGCIQPIIYPDGSKGCLNCNSSVFQPLPFNSKCVCQTGELLGQLCVDIVGCIAAKQDVDGKPICISCNSAARFNKNPNNQGLCDCVSHTKLSGKACVDICGDGFLIGNLYSCDDGNLANGDGCSSVCSVQVDYRCYNGSSTTPSECSYIGRPLQFALSSIKKAGSANEGVFVFSVSPAISSFGKMDLKQRVSLVCSSTYTLSSITYGSGELTITAAYTEDMEGRECTLAIEYDRKYIIGPNATMHFQAVSDDFPLVIIEDPSKVQSLGFFFDILSYIVLALFLVSLSHKMIGPELLVTCQVVYLSKLLYGRATLFSLVIKRFDLVTGGWSFFANEFNGDKVLYLAARVEINPYFLQNSVFVLPLLLLSWIAWIILMGYNGNLYRTFQSDIDTLKLKETYTLAQKATKILYFMLLYPMTSGFFITLSLAGFLNNLRLKLESQEIFNQSINSSFQMLTWLAMSTVLFVQFTDLNKKKAIQIKLSGLQNVRSWYIPLFLGRSACLILLLKVGASLGTFKMIIYPIGVISTIYSLIILIGRPYQRNICNITILIAEFTAIASIVLPVLQQHMEISQTLQVFIIYSIMVLVCLSILFTLFRLVLLYRFIFYRFCHNQESILCTKSSIPSSKPTNPADLANEPKHTRKNPYSIYTPQDQKYIKNDIDQSVKSIFVPIIEPFENALHSILSPKEPPENAQLREIKSRLREDLLMKKRKKDFIYLEIE